MRVDLPEPDGPITVVSWPLLTSSEIPRRASTAVSPSPYRRATSFAMTTAPFAFIGTTLSSPAECWSCRTEPGATPRPPLG